MKQIQIDLETHKLIESHRNSFEETENDILKRIIGMSDISTQNGIVDIGVSAQRPWKDDGVELPHGTEMKFVYNNTRHTARIDDGRIAVGNKQFNSLSGAAKSVARTKKGRQTEIDGWKYWEVKLPSSDEWVAVKSLRRSISLEDLGL